MCGQFKKTLLICQVTYNKILIIKNIYMMISKHYHTKAREMVLSMGQLAILSSELIGQLTTRSFLKIILLFYLKKEIFFEKNVMLCMHSSLDLRWREWEISLGSSRLV